MNPSFLKTLRDRASQCSNVEYRAVLRQAADSVQHTVRMLSLFPTVDRMQDLNGAWASAQRILDNTPAEGDPAPVSGAPEVARLAA